MTHDHLNIVFVGHVDHGKSTLIGRLLYETGSLPDGVLDEIKKASHQLGHEIEYAYILDNLREEREQGITIDTTQVFFRHNGRDYVIIDAPGHVEFVRNMATGASQADAAIILLDAQEGIKEQTRRHAYILDFLGLRKVIVAINKMDAVGYSKERFDEVAGDLNAFMASLGIEPIHYIPISAKAGENILVKSQKMPWYSGPTFIDALSKMKRSSALEDRPLVYSVQDVYVVGGKRIFAGRVESGLLRAGDVVTVLPNPRKSRIKSIEVYPKDDVVEAGPGSNVGVTLEDKLFVERGNMICSPPLPNVSQNINARIFWMSQKPMKEGEKLTIKIGTQETPCKVEVKKRINSSTLEEIKGSTLEDNEVAEATITVDKPLAYKYFNDLPELGRFVLVRDYDTVAGGIIVE